MPFEYEALVGHLYVVGGRSISATPPGFLVEVAPKKAARGRETDTYFTLVLPSGENIASAAFYEEMSRVSAERYFDSTGSVTAGLRSMFNSLNDDLLQHNATTIQPYAASILVAVLRGTDLYLGRVGIGVAVLRHQGEMQPFPNEFTSEDARYGTPLGVQPLPDVKMTHFPVIAGTRLVMGDAGLALAEMEPLAAAMGGEDIAAVLVALKEMMAAHGTLMAVEFVPPEAQVDFPVLEGESTTQAKEDPETPATEDADANSNTDSKAKSNKRKRPASAVEAPFSNALSKSAIGLGRITQRAARGMDKVMPTPKSGQRGMLNTPAAAGAAIIIPVIVVVMVLLLWVTGTGESEFEQCAREATSAAELARGIASSDVAGTLAAWNAVLTVSDRCEQLHAGDLMLAVYRTEGRQIIDSLLQVDRRQMSQLVSFPNASLTKMVLQGEDLYALDEANDLVYRVKIGEDGHTMVPGSQQAVPSMRRTARVGDYLVGDMLDINWATDGAGLSQGNVLLALDDQGVLVECPPRFLDTLSCDSQKLQTSNTWVDARAMAIWQNRLYILDPGANQIWRYEPAGGAYSNSPTEYFVGTRRPDIRTAVDFDIDQDGNIFILFAEGAVTKFTAGEQTPFGFAGFPDGQMIIAANSMFLNNNPLARGLFITDREGRSVYETTLGGSFIAAYRPQDEEDFTTLTDVVADDNQQMVYAAAGNTIFAFGREG